MTFQQKTSLSLAQLNDYQFSYGIRHLFLEGIIYQRIMHLLSMDLDKIYFYHFS